MLYSFLFLCFCLAPSESIPTCISRMLQIETKPFSSFGGKVSFHRSDIIIGPWGALASDSMSRIAHTEGYSIEWNEKTEGI